MSTSQNLIQSLNMASLLVILACIFRLFTDKALTVCVIFRYWSIRPRKVKLYFSIFAVVTIIRLAAYIVDFDRAGSPPFAVFFNAVIGFGFCFMTIKIWHKRREIRRRAVTS